MAMNAHWWKLVLLLVYILLLFVIVRVLELLSTCNLTLLKGEVLQPFSQKSVRSLQAVLAQRGISYNYVERQELEKLINETGAVTAEELAAANAPESTAITVAGPDSYTVFRSEALFNEKVEDNKDSVWLLLVSNDPDLSGGQEMRGGPGPPSLLQDYDWRLLVRHYSRFGIRAGRLDCLYLERTCSSRGLDRAGLILTVPRGKQRTKDAVNMHVYPYPSTTTSSGGSRRRDSVAQWIEAVLASRIKQVRSWDEVLIREDGHLSWLASSPPGPLHFVTTQCTTANLLTVPLVLSALSVRFTGRVHFWSLVIPSPCAPPSYWLISPDSDRYHYGKAGGEYLAFAPLNLLFRLTWPDANDVFLCGMVLCNLLALLHACLHQARSLLHWLCCGVWSFLLHNMVYLLLSLPVIALFNLNFMSPVLNGLLWALRRLALSCLGQTVRRDALLGYYSLPIVGGTLTLVCYLARVLGRCYCQAPAQDERQPQSDPASAVTEPALANVWDLESGELTLLTSLTGVIDLRLPDLGASGDEASLCPDLLDDLLLVWNYEEDDHWPSSVILSTRCAICLRRYRAGIALCALPCGHAFHDLCSRHWILTGRPDCPTCRSPLSKAKLH